MVEWRNQRADKEKGTTKAFSAEGSGYQGGMQESQLWCKRGNREV